VTRGSAQLRWTVKRSFVDYIARMPDGRMSVTDGADVDGVVFTFEHDRTIGDGGSEAVCYRGDVRFSGHTGLLFVCIADPIINRVGDRATVSILQPASSQRSAERVDLGSGRWEDRGGGWHRLTDLRLSVLGSELFAGVYAPGDELDDAEFFLAGQPSPGAV
jgi:hypothetical protein